MAVFIPVLRYDLEFDRNANQCRWLDFLKYAPFHFIIFPFLVKVRPFRKYIVYFSFSDIQKWFTIATQGAKTIRTNIVIQVDILHYVIILTFKLEDVGE